MDVELRVDCRARLGPLRRIWASIGYDEINWTYTARGKALYRTLRDLAEVPYYVRNHNALTSGNGLSEPARGSTNVYQEAPDGSPVYDWTLVDRIYDTIAGVGFRPVIELGFLPRDLVPAEAQAASWSRSDRRHGRRPEGGTPRDDARGRLEAVILGLPVTLRLAVTMRKLHGLDYGAIGASLDCAAETARAHVLEALRQIRRGLDGLPEPRKSGHPAGTITTGRAPTSDRVSRGMDGVDVGVGVGIPSRPATSRRGA
jgi:hypothetical protein